MPNWCHNALGISGNNAAEKQVTDLLFNDDDDEGMPDIAAAIGKYGEAAQLSCRLPRLCPHLLWAFFIYCTVNLSIPHYR